MKVCVIGDSHMAMVAAAYHATSNDDMQMVFFGKPGLAVEEVSLDGTVLSFTDKRQNTLLAEMGTPEKIDLSEFDAIVFVAMAASIFSAVGLVSQHRVAGWPSTQEMLQSTPLDAPFKTHLLSQAAMQANLVETTKRGATFYLLQGLRHHSQVPVFVVPQPYPSERVLKRAGKYGVFKRVHWAGEGKQIVASLVQSYIDVFAPIDQVTLLQQSASTISKDFFTSDEYSRDGVRLRELRKQGRKDILHANAAFGERVLEQLKAKMA
jgi:hypothetical protein